MILFGKMFSKDAVRLLTRIAPPFRMGLTSHDHDWWWRGLRHMGTERRSCENRSRQHAEYLLLQARELLQPAKAERCKEGMVTHADCHL